jgi:hypothetical protein
MGNDNIEEVYRVAARKDVAETGGGHNQKGVDFQRAWAVERMFDLEKSGANDFLFLFETIQDVAELDSPIAPSAIRIYQVKKRDRNEWSWAELTHLVEPGTKRRISKKNIPSPDIKDSPIGKLYSAVLAFRGLKCSGKFISNNGCNLPLRDGRNAASSMPCDLSNLADAHLTALVAGLEALHEAGTLPTKPALIHVEKVRMHPDEPTKHLIGTVVMFLNNRSPRHAGQAHALVEALLSKVGPLGRKTDSCASFAELKKERGYTRAEFSAALSDLEDLPDLLALLEDWLDKLESDGAIGFMEKLAVRVSASKIFRLQVMGGEDPTVSQLLPKIDAWLDTHAPGASLTAFLNEAQKDLADATAMIRSADFIAHFLLRALKQNARS